MIAFLILVTMVVGALTQWKTTFVSARMKVLCTILEDTVNKVLQFIKQPFISNCL